MRRLARVIATLDLPATEKKAVEKKCIKLIENHLLDWILEQLSFEDQKTWTTMMMNPREKAHAEQFLARKIERFQSRSKEEMHQYESELIAKIKEVTDGLS